MSASRIIGAIKDHVEAAMDAQPGPHLPGAWPNVPHPGGTPRYEFEMAAADRSGLLAAGEFVRETGRFALTAVTAAGKGEFEGLELADALAATVPDGLSLDFPGGRIRIMGPATVRPGYRDGPEWRVPVLVRYDAFLP